MGRVIRGWLKGGRNKIMNERRNAKKIRFGVGKDKMHIAKNKVEREKTIDMRKKVSSERHKQRKERRNDEKVCIFLLCFPTPPPLLPHFSSFCLGSPWLPSPSLLYLSLSVS